MEIVLAPITIDQVRSIADKTGLDFVKVVVDVKKGIMAIDGDTHADLQYMLTEEGSQADDTWGVNLHPDRFGQDGFITFDADINYHPTGTNKDNTVEDSATRVAIAQIIKRLVSA